jgi:hypothetical protein
VTPLYWNDRGAIACEQHAPFKGSDTWLNERWRTMHKAARDGLRTALGHEAGCETCESVARVKAKAEGK